MVCYPNRTEWLHFPFVVALFVIIPNTFVPLHKSEQLTLHFCEITVNHSVTSALSHLNCSPVVLQFLLLSNPAGGKM